MQSSTNAIEQTLKSLLVSSIEGTPEVRSDTDLTVDLGLESVQIMEFVVEVEDRYDIAIDLNTLSGVRTISDLAAVVARII
ncbi:MAG: acyl carrier protein [Pseudomonadota bacterium]